MLRFKRWKARGGLGSDQPGTSAAWLIEDERQPGSVNSRQIKLWRKDGRYAGYVTIMRDPESDGVVLEFDALRHGAKEPRLHEVVAPEHVDKLILSLLEVRSGELIRDEGEGGDG